MRRLLPIAVISGALALVTISFFSAFGPGIAGVSLPLLLVVTRIIRFRSGEAVAAAVGAGIVTDILTATAAPLHTVEWVLLAFIMFAVFSRVFTHLTIAAFAAMNIVGYLVLVTLNTAVDALRAAFGDLPHMPMFDTAGLAVFAVSLAMQIGAAFLLLLAAAFVRRFAARYLMLGRS